jgi:hypothetical protein
LDRLRFSLGNLLLAQVWRFGSHDARYGNFTQV